MDGCDGAILDLVEHPWHCLLSVILWKLKNMSEGLPLDFGKFECNNMFPTGWISTMGSWAGLLRSRFNRAVKYTVQLPHERLFHGFCTTCTLFFCFHLSISSCLTLYCLSSSSRTCRRPSELVLSAGRTS